MSISFQEYLSLYESMTKMQKRVWNNLRFYHRIYKGNVFPSLETLTEKPGCSKRTVQRAIKYFIELGLLMTIKRGHTSSKYIILLPKEFILKDPAPKACREIPFSEGKCHQNVHVVFNNRNNIYNPRLGQSLGSSEFVQNSKIPEEEKVSPMVKDLRVDKSAQKFSLKYSEWVVMRACEHVKTYAMRYKPRNRSALFVDALKREAKNIKQMRPRC